MAYRGVVIDLDGTVYRHRDPIDGAVAAVRRLRKQEVELLFFSNNPTASPADYVDRLADMGIAATVEEVLSSASITADYLAANHTDDAVYVVGSEPLCTLLRERNVTLTTDFSSPDVVLGSWSREFDYDTLREAMWALEGDIPFLGTDPDVTVPIGEGRSVPGSGAIIAALASVAGREPRILGKPSLDAGQAAKAALGVPASETLVVGDRPDTDLRLGDRMGMDTALVLTGVTRDDDIEAAAVTPDHVLPSIVDLPPLLEGGDPPNG